MPHLTHPPPYQLMPDPAAPPSAHVDLSVAIRALETLLQARFHGEVKITCHCACGTGTLHWQRWFAKAGWGLVVTGFGLPERTLLRDAPLAIRAGLINQSQGSFHELLRLLRLEEKTLSNNVVQATRRYEAFARALDKEDA